MSNGTSSMTEKVYNRHQVWPVMAKQLNMTSVSYRTFMVDISEYIYYLLYEVFSSTIYISKFHNHWGI